MVTFEARQLGAGGVPGRDSRVSDRICLFKMEHVPGLGCVDLRDDKTAEQTPRSSPKPLRAGSGQVDLALKTRRGTGYY